MGSLAVLISVLVATLAPTPDRPEIQAPKAQSDWRSLLTQAELLACNISYSKNRAIWPADSARQLAREALTLIDPLSSEADSARAVTLTCLGDYFMRDSSLARARELWTAAAQAADKIPSPLNPVRRSITWRQMILARESGYSRIADSLYQEALLDSTPTATLENRAVYLRQLAQIYTKLLRLDLNWRTNEQIVREWRDTQVGDARLAVVALMDLAEGASKFTLTNVQNRFAAQDSAIQLGEEALRVAGSKLGESDTCVGYVLNRLGDYYIRRGDAERARTCWNEAYRINLAALPPEAVECQGSISRMGNVAAGQGEFSQAEKLLSLAVELRKKTQGEGHQEVAAMISSLAILYRQMGQFDRAESLLTVALSIRKVALPANHPDIATNLNLLGRVCLDQGRTAEAETCWRDALAIQRSQLGSENASTVSTLQNLASLYQTWGRTEEAEQMLRTAVSAKRAFLGSDHPDVAYSLLALAGLHVKSRKLTLAHREVDSALAIFTIHGDSLNSAALMAVADINLAEGKMARADSLITIVLNDTEQRLGETNFQLLSPLVRHAEACRDKNELDRAEQLYARALFIALANDVTRSNRMVDLLSSYAELKLKKRNTQEAQSLFARALDIALSGFRDGCRVLPELKALRLARQIHGLRDKCISSIFLPGSTVSPQATVVAPEMAVVLLSAKAAVSESMTRRKSELLRTNHDGVTRLLDSLHDASIQLSRIYLDDDLDTAFAGFDRRLRTVSARKLRLEEELARLGFKSGKGDRVEGFDQSSAAALLENATPFVEYIKYESTGLGEAPGIARYAAFVSFKSELYAIDLGKASFIDGLVAKCQLQMQTISTSGVLPDSAQYREYTKQAGLLVDKIWQPVRALLPDSGKIYISPDGALNLVAFGALPNPGDSFLVESYSFCYLGTIRDAQTQEGDSDRTTGLLAFGAPDFEADPIQRLPEVRQEPPSSPRDSRYVVTRGMPANCRVPREALAPLLASLSEVEIAGRLWQSTHADSAIILSGKAASEENFKRLATGKRFIHIATHAFSLSKDCFPTALEDITEANPLLLSGLLLAGAGAPTAVDSSRTCEDGVLSSEEIACLDLRGTKCVVLSACESGLGAVTDGEGVYGLRRAFQLAGAETIVGSLWAVPDPSTARLMRRLYQNLDEDIPAAVRRAQIAAIGELRAAGLPPHPYSWGAFTVMGK